MDEIEINEKQESIIATISRQDNQDRNKKQSKEKETEKINNEFKVEYEECKKKQDHQIRRYSREIIFKAID